MGRKLKGTISIGRTASNISEDAIRIEIIDSSSRTHFVEARMTLKDFALAITNLGCTPIEFEVKGLERVGKVRESKELVFLIPPSDFRNTEYAEENCQLYADKGWIADRHFRSRDSIRRHEDGQYFAHGTQCRFVDPVDDVPCDYCGGKKTHAVVCPSHKRKRCSE